MKWSLLKSVQNLGLFEEVPCFLSWSMSLKILLHRSMAAFFYVCSLYEALCMNDLVNSVSIIRRKIRWSFAAGFLYPKKPHYFCSVYDLYIYRLIDSG
jgi:hypothetical protein